MRFNEDGVVLSIISILLASLLSNGNIATFATTLTLRFLGIFGRERVFNLINEERALESKSRLETSKPIWSSLGVGHGI
ncbi:hypothetical protein JMJ77_0004793 [Colletotrichum scovillei]|uniref:Uncharacterized protein n=1 Tax=Colletotrichum scovillei TaxID=1209932 RepID=A0A9P7RI47_9PEZI|nr:hypothetical protein JMJ77_0004793 [Colletotrichum scovillei]KAG7076002.1 hypothetical protein JMJ76_0013274 [Colletotrichum scovillei]KAG7083085.1 hypothetical protein JMJ78_0008535 [Colletotrichum scovillei]